MTQMATGEPHFAELLLTMKLRGTRDPLRSRSGFSDDIQQANAILHNARVPRLRKIAAYRNWLRTEQPCVFGRGAAGKRQVFICLVDEREILLMRRGDHDLRSTIEDHRRVWKRHALHGLSSSFVLVVVSPTLCMVAPGAELKEACRRLMEPYVGASVPDDTILPQREYVYLAKTVGEKRILLKFATLPNLFCPQGDQRWWHDHRTPGGIMITSNALGNFMHGLNPGGPPDTCRALKQAFMTIQNAFASGNRRLRQPATRLETRPTDESSPLNSNPTYGQFSAQRYRGWFHTDHLIPSAFFNESQPKHEYRDLDFSYIHDPAAEDHAELMAGEPATAYEVKREVWAPDNKDRFRDFSFDRSERVAAYQWLESRLHGRCQ
jgi:hypothetical protein